MRYMIIVKATDESETNSRPARDEALLQDMLAYHEPLNKAGVLLDGSDELNQAKGDMK